MDLQQDSSGKLEDNLRSEEYEIIKIKLQLRVLKDILYTLDLKVYNKCKSFTEFLMSNNFQEIEQIENKIYEDFKLIKTDIQDLREKMEHYITKAKTESKKKIRYSVFIEDSSLTRASQISKSSGELQQIPIVWKKSILDERKLTQNLYEMRNLVEDLLKKNKNLKNQNTLLTQEILAITELTYNIKMEADGHVQLYEDKSKSPYKTDEEDDFDQTEDLNEIFEHITQIQSDVANMNFLFVEEKSFSHELLRPQDKSFIIDVSETRILTDEDWKIALARLKRETDEMALNEMKLATIKAIAQYGGIIKM